MHVGTTESLNEQMSSSDVPKSIGTILSASLPSVLAADNDQPGTGLLEEGSHYSTARIRGGFQKKAMELLLSLERQAIELRDEIACKAENTKDEESFDLYLSSTSARVRKMERVAQGISNLSPDVVEKKSAVIHMLDQIEARITVLGCELPKKNGHVVIYKTGNCYCLANRSD